MNYRGTKIIKDSLVLIKDRKIDWGNRKENLDRDLIYTEIMMWKHDIKIDWKEDPFVVHKHDDWVFTPLCDM